MISGKITDSSYCSLDVSVPSDARILRKIQLYANMMRLGTVTAYGSKDSKTHHMIHGNVSHVMGFPSKMINAFNSLEYSFYV